LLDGILGSNLCAIKDSDACVLIHYTPGIQLPEKFENSPLDNDLDSVS